MRRPAAMRFFMRALIFPTARIDLGASSIVKTIVAILLT
jgi:hypothetical protein